MKAVLVIPTYNEKENIKRLLPRVLKVFSKIKDWKPEILIVDDNSPDGTSKAVKGAKVLLRLNRQGLGAAYLAGMREAFVKMRADVVLTMDADLSHDPKYIPLFLKKISGVADLVIGSRYIEGGKIAQGWAPHRKLLSVFGNKIVTVFLGQGPTDWTSGYRAISKRLFAKVAPKLLEVRGYTFNVSFAYYAKISGFKISEVPIKFIDRTRGKSKLGLEYLFHTPAFLFKTRLREVLGLN